MSYSKLYDDFKGWLTADSLKLSKKTVGQYLFIVKKLFTYMRGFNIPTLNNFSYETFSRFIHLKPNKAHYSVPSINQRIAALDIFFSWAIKEQWASENSNPVVTYKKMRIESKRLETSKNCEENKVDILTTAEQDKLMLWAGAEDFLSVRNHCIAVLILSTGLYAHEVVNLTLDSMNAKQSYVMIGKGSNKERKIFINSEICKNTCLSWELIRQNFLGSHTTPYYFITEKLTPMDTVLVYYHISRLLKKCAIDKNQKGPDLLRQTAIFNFLKKGLTHEEVSKITGITTSAQLQKYQTVM